MGAQAKGFTCHEESGWKTMLIACVLLLLAEGVAVHLLLRDWNSWVADLHTVLVLGSVAWLLLDYSALKRSLTELTSETLEVRVGKRKHLSIPLGQIAEIRLGEPAGAGDFEEPKMGQFSSEKKIPGYVAYVAFGRPCLHLLLREKIQIRRMMGKAAWVDKIGLGVDHPDRFIEALHARLPLTRTKP
jgi:hypothetical protein